MMFGLKKEAPDRAEKVPAEELEGRIVEALRTVFDPEIPVNIYDLGLVYALDVDENGGVAIKMTLTAPGCPVAQTFPGEVESKVSCVPGVTSAKVDLVWEPPWSQDMMSDEAKLQLGML